MSENTLVLPVSLRFLRSLEFPRKLGILEKMYGKDLAAHGVTKVQCANGVTWRLDLSDSCHRWIVYGRYEGGLAIDYARKVLSQGGTYVDSGASIGQWLLYFLDLQNVRRLAFEPISFQYSWLLKCLEESSAENTRCFNFALGSERDTLTIQVFGSKSTFVRDWYTSKDLVTEEVAVKRLDEVMSEEGITSIDFWKLDVEGHELDAMKGASGLFEANKILNVYFECHPDNFVKCRDYLNSFGYELFQISPAGIQSFNESSIKETRNFLAKPR